jgi:hypothetical protein
MPFDFNPINQGLANIGNALQYKRQLEMQNEAIKREQEQLEFSNMLNVAKIATDIYTSTKDHNLANQFVGRFAPKTGLPEDVLKFQPVGKDGKKLRTIFKTSDGIYQIEGETDNVRGLLEDLDPKDTPDVIAAKNAQWNTSITEYDESEDARERAKARYGGGSGGLKEYTISQEIDDLRSDVEKTKKQFTDEFGLPKPEFKAEYDKVEENYEADRKLLYEGVRNPRKYADGVDVVDGVINKELSASDLKKIIKYKGDKLIPRKITADEAKRLISVAGGVEKARKLAEELNIDTGV